MLLNDVPTADSEDTIDCFFAAHVVTARRRAVPVVDVAHRYVGMLFLGDVLAVDQSAWASTRLKQVLRTDAPTGRPDWTIGQAMAAMVGADVDHLAVLDTGGRLAGMCTATDILDLDELLDRLGEERHGEMGQPS